MTMGYGGRSKADTSGRQLPRASELQVREADLWPQCYEYVPQVVSLRRNAVWPEPPLTLGLTFARTLADVGTFLWHTGQFKDCEEAMQSAENLVNMQELTIRDTPEMMALLSDLYTITGIIADCIGVSRRAESLDHRDKALVLREKAFADIPRDQVTTNDEIRLWNTHCDRACAFMQRNRYEEAGEVFEKALERYQTWGREAEYPYKYSKYYHHMAFVLMARGASARAISYARKGADLVEMHAKGTLDTTVLIWKYDLASLLFNAGKVGESLALHEWILDHRRRLCGEGSQMTLESHESVAVIQHLRGNHYPARRHLEQSLESRHRANWTEEGIARAHFWLYKTLEASGAPDTAAKERDAALAAKRRYLQDYAEFLYDDPMHEEAVFDQMLPMWIMQTSGPLQQYKADGKRAGFL